MALLLVSAMISVLTVLMIIWIAPAVGVHDSACERYPLSAGCRLPAAPDHESPATVEGRQCQTTSRWYFSWRCSAFTVR